MKMVDDWRNDSTRPESQMDLSPEFQRKQERPDSTGNNSPDNDLIVSKIGTNYLI